MRLKYWLFVYQSPSTSRFFLEKNVVISLLKISSYPNGALAQILVGTGDKCINIMKNRLEKINV